MLFDNWSYISIENKFQAHYTSPKGGARQVHTVFYFNKLVLNFYILIFSFLFSSSFLLKSLFYSRGLSFSFSILSLSLCLFVFPVSLSLLSLCLSFLFVSPFSLSLLSLCLSCLFVLSSCLHTLISLSLCLSCLLCLYLYLCLPILSLSLYTSSSCFFAFFLSPI